MAVLKIGKAEFQFDPEEDVIPVSGNQAPQHTGELDNPFTDEICIELDRPAEGEARFYVVRLMAGTDLQKVKPGSRVSIPVPDPRGPEFEGDKITGKVVWLDDEAATPSYNLASLDLNFALPVSKGDDVSLQPFNPADYGLNADKLRAEILKALELTPGMPVTEEVAIDRFKRSQQLLELFADKVFGFGPIKISWGKAGFDTGEPPTVKLELVIFPPPKEVTIEFVDTSTEGGTLPPDKEKQLRAELGEKWGEWFKPPLTAAHVAKGTKELTDYFKSNNHYALAPPTEVIDGQQIFVPPLIPTINERGQLVLKTRLRPLPTTVEIVRIEYGEDGKPIGEPERMAGNIARVIPPAVLSDANIEKYLVDLQRAYEADIRFVTVKAKPTADGKLMIRLHLERPPTRIETKFDLPGITDEEITANLSKWFDPKGTGYFTRTSIEEGRKAFREWCEEEGIHLRLGEPAYDVKGRVLKLFAHASRMTTFEVLFVAKNGEMKRLFLDSGKGKPDINDPGDYANLLKHFRQRVYGSRTTAGRLVKDKRFDESALREAIAEIGANYPSVQATYDVTPIDPRDPESTHVRVILHDRSLWESVPVIRLNASGGMTILRGDGVEATEGSLNLGATVISRDGTETSINVGRTSYSQKIRTEGEGGASDEVRKVAHARIDLGASRRLLWVRRDGTSVLFGLNVSIPTEGNAYPYALAPYAEADIPTRLFSHWGWLAGANASTAWGGPVDGTEVWGNPYGGVRYFDRVTQGRVTGGPVAGNRGVYGESRASLDHRIPISEDEKWNIRLHGRTRVQGGEVPWHRQSSGADVLGGPGILPLGQRSRVSAAVGADLDRTLGTFPFVGPVSAGLHAAAKCVGDECVVAGGFYLGGAGLRLGLLETGVGPEGFYVSPATLSASW